MTNEQLAISARTHEEWATLELWEAVRRFVSQEAIKYLQRGDNSARVEYDDLMQSGFLAMLDAIVIYDPEREANFLTVMKWEIKNRFAEAGGHRTKRLDPLTISESLDVPAFREDPEGEKAGDMIEDQCSEYAFLLVEYEDFREYCRNLLFASMEYLHPCERDLIIRYFFQGQTLEAISKYKKSTRQNISAIIQRYLRRLRHGKYHYELREALDGFEDFRALNEDRGRPELKAIAKRKP